MIKDGQLLNYIGGKWKHSRATEFLDVRNPATAETMVRVPLSPPDEVDEAVQAAQAAFADWRRTPPLQRIQYLFKLKKLLDEHFDEIARLTVDECGKTLEEARGELQRGVENVEIAIGIPTLMQGYNSEDIARGIDEHMFRQPVGVVAAITPFNFPGMIPLWFLPYAIACGNCFILKPSEKVPMTMSRVFDLIDELDLPPGVISLVNGSKGAVDTLLDHPLVRAISFVGSSPVAKYV
ncbi:MAG: aldehyde dehydrogenase family protein, partial [Chloroflexi bacterium]|nr:aldehyde dehydrogenase family protein [Chloroflexota bacterium]